MVRQKRKESNLKRQHGFVDSSVVDQEQACELGLEPAASSPTTQKKPRLAHLRSSSSTSFQSSTESPDDQTSSEQTIASNQNKLEEAQVLLGQLRQKSDPSLASLITRLVELHSSHPPVEVRTQGQIRMDFIEAWTTAMANNVTVGARSMADIFVTLANSCFGQNWKHPDSKVEPKEDELISYLGVFPKVKSKTDRTPFHLGARSTMSNFMTDVALLNLEYVANIVMDPTQSITYGVDDVTKQSGHKNTKSVKVDNVTAVNRETREVRNLSAGVVEMGMKDKSSQKGAMDFTLILLAILSREENDDDGVTLEDVLEAVDFFMSDREAACNAALREYSLEGTGP
eukprot:Lithocolla_globosa_v1_NODE_626_length_3567_cov_17.757403.p1 type:complete len:343 gc:universal NODE_626_length_3567_cov_17.757403:3117-2089(-)